MTEGDFEEVFADSDDLFAYRRVTESEEILVIVNFKNHAVSYDESVLDGMKILLSSEPGTAPGIMRALEAAIWKKEK